MKQTLSAERVKSNRESASSAKKTYCVSSVDPRKQHKFLETAVEIMLGRAGHFTAVCTLERWLVLREMGRLRQQCRCEIWRKRAAGSHDCRLLTARRSFLQ